MEAALFFLQACNQLDLPNAGRDGLGRGQQDGGRVRGIGPVLPQVLDLDVKRGDRRRHQVVVDRARVSINPISTGFIRSPPAAGALLARLA